MTTSYGFTSAGFVIKTQQTILAELQTSFQSVFGTNVNLSPQGPLGQIMNIYAEREAYIWQLAEAVYSSQYPTGAQGVSVDNILALNNIQRIGSISTKTAGTNSLGIPGLVLLGSAGTVIPSGSIISVNGNAGTQFTLDSTVTVLAAVNARQFIAFAGGPPTLTTPAGQWTLAIKDYRGLTLTTTTLVYNSTAADVQAAIRALNSATVYPFTDVVVSGSFASGGFTVDFGAVLPGTGQPSSGSQSQNLFTIPLNTLLNQTIVVNSYITTTVVGAPAQGIGSATCTVAGPTYVAANELTVIGSPVSGWNSVNNPLDCITGSNVESDATALLRRKSLLSTGASGPLASIIDKVANVAGVVNAVGYENTSMASWQRATFTGTASAGTYTMTFAPSGGGSITSGTIPWNAQDITQVITFTGSPSGGHFHLTFNSVQSAAIQYSATSIDVQTALRAVTGCANAIVTGSFAVGFHISFGKDLQYTLVATNSLTGVSAITVLPSIQSVINGTSGYDGVQISGALSSGLQIIFGGTAGSIAQGAITINAASLTGISAASSVLTLPPKSFQIILNDNAGDATDQDIATAIYNVKPAGIEAYGTTTYSITDSEGNVHVIGFTRASQVPIYVTLALNTDLQSSQNPEFVSGSIPTIQSNIAVIGNTTQIGGLVIGFGSNGLIGAFNNIPGIYSYTLYFGRTASPSTNTNIQLLINEVVQFETYNILVSYV